MSRRTSSNTALASACSPRCSASPSRSESWECSMQGIAISRPPTAGLCLAPDLRHTRPTLVFLASVLLTAAVPALSAAPQVADLRNLSVVRFDFDNDAFLGKDNSFTAGWSVQLHSRLNDVWGPGTAKWIGRVPGLGDGGRGGRIVRWAVGISQVIITPKDVGTAAPQP